MKPLAPIFTAMFVLGTLLGCGGGNGMSPVALTPTSTRASMTGSFGITGMSQTTSQTYLIGGIFQTDANFNLTGTVRIDRSACFDFGTPVTFSGSINAQNQVTLSSSAVTGQVITVTAMISSDGKAISSGTFSVMGGCANGDHGTITGFQVQGMAGTYTGQFMIGGHPVNVSFTITNESGGNTGSSMLTGPATLSVNAALCDLPTSTFVAGVQAGSDVHIVVTDTLGGSATFIGTTSDGTAKTINGTIDLTVCGDTAQLTLTQ